MQSRTQTHVLEEGKGLSTAELQKAEKEVWEP